MSHSPPTSSTHLHPPPPPPPPPTSTSLWKPAGINSTPAAVYWSRILLPRSQHRFFPSAQAKISNSERREKRKKTLQLHSHFKLKFVLLPLLFEPPRRHRRELNKLHRWWEGGRGAAAPPAAASCSARLLGATSADNRPPSPHSPRDST